jgi:amino acid permease
MMAIPKAFQLLGFIAGSAVMLLMALLTFFTLAGALADTCRQQAPLDGTCRRSCCTHTTLFPGVLWTFEA